MRRDINLLLFIFRTNFPIRKRRRGEETRSGTERRCSHNLQSGHPAWWSAGNRCFSHTNYFDKLEANRQEKMIKTLKNNIMHLCFSCISYLSFGTEIAGGN